MKKNDFILKGFYSAAFVVLLVIVSVLSWKNVALNNYKLALENNIVLLNENLVLSQKSEADRVKAEDTASSYLKWKFVLKEQVDQSIEVLKDKAAFLRNASKDKALAALLYYNLGLAETINTDFNSAIGSFEEAVKLDPKNGYSYYNLGLLYSTYKGDLARALSCYKKYLEIFPDGLYAAVVKERIKQLEGVNI